MSGQKLNDAERERLRATVREMLEEAEVLIGEIADPEDADLRLSDLCECFARLGEFEHAKRCLAGIRLNPIYITDCLIDVAAYQCVTGDLKAARITLQEAADSIQALDRSDRPPFIEIHSMLKVWAKYFPREEAVPRVRGALKLAETKGRGWDESKFFGMLIDLTDWEFVQSKVEEADDPEERANRRARIAEAHAESGNIESALQLIEPIESPHTVADTLRIVGEQMVRAGDPDAARAYFLRSYEGYLLEEHPSVRSRDITRIAKHFVSVNDADAEELAWEKTVEAALTQGGTDRIVDLTWIAETLSRLGRSGQSRLVLETAERINSETEMPYRVHHLYWITKAHFECEDRDRAIDLMDEWIELSNQLDDEDEREDSLCSVAFLAAEHDLVPLARRLVPEVFVRSQIKLLTTLDCLSRTSSHPELCSGALDEAVALLATLDDPLQHSYDLGWIAEQLAEHGRFIEAIELAHRIDEALPDSRSSALLEIAASILDSAGLPRINHYGD